MGGEFLAIPGVAIVSGSAETGTDKHLLSYRSTEQLLGDLMLL